MEHRLRSPSRTYSDMPEMLRAHGDGRNHTHHSSAGPRDHVAAESSAYAEARKNGIFVPSSEYIAELLLGGDSPEPEPEPESEPTPEPVQVREVTPPQPRTPVSIAMGSDSNQSDNPAPTPGCSRDPPTTRRRGGIRQRGSRGNSRNQCAVVRPSSTRITRSSSKRLIDTRPETSGATAGTPINCEDDDDDVEIIYVGDSDSDSQSSADSSRNRSFFRDSRLPYTPAEDEEILKFVLTGNNVEKTSSILLWKELEAIKGTPKRTYQSLKNRFLRNIKPYVLTRFKHLLTPQSLRMLRRKFPDLRIMDDKKYVPVRPYEKKVVCVNPSTEGAQASGVTDTHFGLLNFTSVVGPEESEMQKEQAPKRERPSTSSGPINPPAREPENTAGDGEAMETNEESTDSRANETDETNPVWPEPGLTRRLEKVVNIFAREKLVNVPVQSFKYYDTIGTFANKAGINVRLILDRSGVAGLPAELPVNVNVTVTVGNEEENRPQPSRRSPAGRDRDNMRARRDRMRKRRDTKRGPKKGLQRGYILNVRQKYMKNFKSNKWSVKATNSMLYKDELEKLMEDMKSNALTLSSASHSDAEPPTDENVPETYSQLTNCSTEDESCYTQTLKKVSHIYKVEVKPTQSLIEDDSEDFSVGTAPTPPIADKGTVVADTVLMRKGLGPPGRSLYRSGKV